MLLDGLVVELGVVLPARRLAEGRVEDLLLDGRVALQLRLDRLEEGGGVIALRHHRLLELTEERADGSVVGLEKRDRVRRCLRLRGHGHAPGGTRACWLSGGPSVPSGVA